MQNLKYKLRLKINKKLVKPTLLVPQCHNCPRVLKQEISSDINKLFPTVTKNLTGTFLKVSAKPGLALNAVFGKDPQGKITLAGGFCNEIFLILQKKFEFNFSVQFQDGFGKRLPNGTFSGIVGSIQRGEADIAIDIGLSAQRTEVIEYLPPVIFTTVRFFTKMPAHVPRWKLILEPFTASLWLAIFLCLGVISVSYFCFIISEKKIRNIPLQSMSWGTMLRNSGGFIFKPILEQDITDSMWDHIQILRLLATIWFFVSIVFATAYRAKLTTLRSIPLPEIVPETFKELAESEYKPTLHFVGGMIYASIEGSSNPVFKTIGKKLGLEKVLQTCLVEALQGGSACIAMDSITVYEGVKNFSNVDGNAVLRMSKDAFFSIFGGAALKKHSVLSQDFSRSIRRLFDMGIVKRLQDIELTRARQRGRLWAKMKAREEKWRESNNDSPNALSIVDIYAVLIVISIYWLISVGTFSAEFLWVKRRWEFILRISGLIYCDHKTSSNQDRKFKTLSNKYTHSLNVTEKLKFLNYLSHI
ncbi:unnamed protein product [Allacma fusca]|uniref:Ionotropic glutamate receptor L-glutamate and glycine-binding domain-containing protein n=1 Tax=Allacma fusca TaxID=39272 RepID=A0A8J2JG16_9HEXA|nr:unnamed protein product [Allacma fusca]